MSKAQQHMDNIEFFAAEHPSEFSWLNQNKETNSFAGSLWDQLNTKGFLTDNQLKYCKPKAGPKSVGVSESGCEKMLKAFSTARSSGLRKLRLHVKDYIFSLAGENSVNAGSIYVKTGYYDQYLGKITPKGEFFPPRNVKQEIISEITDICRDPLTKAIMHGKETGRCSCCGRELTNPESIARGIGPICAAKWGW